MQPTDQDPSGPKEPALEAEKLSAEAQARYQRRWWVRGFWLAAFVAVLVIPDLIFDALRDNSQPRDPLAAIELQLQERYSFSHMMVQGLQARQAGDQDYVLFDVRQPAEYAVSHIAGAIQVDPGISAVDFMARYGALIADRDVIFYCSVGRRASRLAARVEKPVAAAGTRVHNLSGGIFRWHGDELPLV
ncbi:MAG: rhodanese-like domain-containing protein, partial [Pseudomonadota bacterium]